MSYELKPSQQDVEVYTEKSSIREPDKETENVDQDDPLFAIILTVALSVITTMFLSLTLTIRYPSTNIFGIVILATLGSLFLVLLVGKSK